MKYLSLLLPTCIVLSSCASNPTWNNPLYGAVFNAVGNAIEDTTLNNCTLNADPLIFSIRNTHSGYRNNPYKSTTFYSETMKNAVIDQVRWDGECSSGRANGEGVAKLVFRSFSDRPAYKANKFISEPLYVKGTAVNGEIEGAWTTRSGQIKLGTFGRSAATSSSIHECAASLSIPCVQSKLQSGSDINEKTTKQANTPIFYAIDALRQLKQETTGSIKMLEFLIRNGADLDYKTQPYTIRIGTSKELYTPLDFVEKETRNSPRSIALFKNSQLLAENKQALRANTIANELGISHGEYENRVKLIPNYRSRNTFDGYADAFLISRDKSDFIAAQKLAKKQFQKQKLEYLAIMAVPDKTKVFDISFTMPNASVEPSIDSSETFEAFIILKMDTKSSSKRFKLTSKISKSKAFPYDLKYGTYKVKVKFTLAIPLKETTRAAGWFGITMVKKEENIKRFFLEKEFVLKPRGYAASKVLDFGNIEISSLSKAWSATLETKLGKPQVISEILSIEQL